MWWNQLRKASSADKVALARKVEADKTMEEQRLAGERKRLEEDRRRMEVERIAREGDGSEDDIFCQKRKLTPTTPQYLNCRTSMVDKREKDEAARTAAEEKNVWRMMRVKPSA